MNRATLLLAVWLCFCSAGPPSPIARTEDTWRRTYALLADRDTITVENVWSAPGGYEGKIFGAVRGSRQPWIHYRVWLGPDETVSRIDLAMTSMVDPTVKDFTPLLVARHFRDSVVIEPAAASSGFPVRRFAVSSNALLGMGYSAASWEQALRRARRIGPGAEFQIVEPMNGQIWDATVTELAQRSVELSVPPEVWRFTLDARGRISGGSHSMGSEPVRLVVDER